MRKKIRNISKILAKQMLTPAELYDSLLVKIKQGEITQKKLKELELAEAESKGTGMFTVETPAACKANNVNQFDVNYKEAVCQRMSSLKSRYGNTITAEKLKDVLGLTDVFGISPGFANMETEIKDITEKDLDKRCMESHIKAHELRISGMLKQMEHAISKNDIYKACYCCFQIGESLHSVKTLPFNKSIQHKLSLIKGRRIRAVIDKKGQATDTEIYQFYQKVKKESVKKFGQRGSSKEALDRTAAKYACSVTKIKNTIKRINDHIVKGKSPAPNEIKYEVSLV